ncbi:hypothetical protein NYO91_05180 [Arhodomonas aquaeolei]|uniref:siroheme decarboxylase subunit beta n=1 Tax=Arhodomonas aquaeolei TaxID=2369 RepID=UPI00216A5D38|nr:hypothetical protein [Arhodomonas aquaeolei]MCS4503469.1 hypothetical protein [Arhodomonas aquaeolei]
MVTAAADIAGAGTAADPDGVARALLRAYARGLPLEPRPYRAMARHLGVGEGEVIAALGTLADRGWLARVGAVFRPGAVGASTLAALAVPPSRLETVAAQVNAYRGVNHNYEREHRYSLWFVVTAASRPGVDAVLDGVAADTGLAPLDLPLESAYHLDLAGLMAGEGDAPRTVTPRPPAEPLVLDPAARHVLAALEDGLALVPRPFAAVAARAGVDEAEVLARLRAWRERGAVVRYGLIARHRRLGYRANAMVVWDVPDEQVDAVAGRIAGYRFVTLCYRRPRRLPEWRYNLFSMIHGRDRATVRAQAQALAAAAGPAVRDRQVLFSRRCFRQRGASYAPAPAGAGAVAS